jgi:hypothetical protein
MVDLQLSSGLSIKFDELAEKFLYGDDITFSSINRIPLASMLPGLLNKSLKYPENVYLEHRNICRKSDEEIFRTTGYNYDLLMLPSGLMGVEFIRSHIFYAACDGGQRLSEIVEVISGSLTILLQKNKEKIDEYEFDTSVSEGLVIRLTQGEKFAIPKGYYYTFINTRTKPVVFSRFYTKGCVCDYTLFKKEQGLAYFAIRKNAKQEIVLNPRYREIPQIRKTTPKDAQASLNPPVKSEEPLYVQIVSGASSFSSWL